MILNRRTLLASLGLSLPAFGAAAATASHHKKKKPTHALKTASARTHHKPHAHKAPTQS